jgi:hypothetical protein
MSGVLDFRYARWWNLDPTKAVLDDQGTPIEPIPLYVPLSDAPAATSMIGNYFDAMDCQWMLPFASWGKGNGTSDKKTGNFPAYPEGVYSNWEMLDMSGSGIGYKYVDSMNSYLQIDHSASSRITGQWPLSFTNTNDFTLASKFRIPYAEAPFMVAGGYPGSASYWFINVAANLVITFLIRIEGVNYYAQSTTGKFSDYDKDFLLTCIKDGSALKIYVDSTLAASSDDGVPYTGGDYTFLPGDNHIGQYYTTGTGNYGRYYWTGLWNHAFSIDEIKRYARAPNNLGLYGYSRGNAMELSSNKKVLNGKRGDAYKTAGYKLWPYKNDAYKMGAYK